jgi:hypothetical protein
MPDLLMLVLPTDPVHLHQPDLTALDLHTEPLVHITLVLDHALCDLPALVDLQELEEEVHTADHLVVAHHVEDRHTVDLHAEVTLLADLLEVSEEPTLTLLVS